MWLVAMVLAGLAALAAPLLSTVFFNDHQASTGEARVVAEGMAVYRTAVVDYAAATPGFDGVVTDGSLPGPTWWQRDPAIHAAVQGPIVAVYMSGRQVPGLVGEMQRLSGGAIWVGYADSATGTLHSPTFGDTGLPVPPSVPDQAPVWLATRN